MKIKTLFLILIIFIPGGIPTLPVSFQGNSNIVVKDIEYLSGEDFVQVYFKIDQMIPIPDVFYPDKDDSTRIVMRMTGVSFNPSNKLFRFDSSIIDFIKVTPNTTNTDVDIEIQLKGQVNYRVFTNQKGLYIEFPEVKPLSSPSSSSLPPPTSNSTNSSNSTPSASTSQPSPVKSLPDTGDDPGKSTGAAPAATVTPEIAQGTNVIDAADVAADQSLNNSCRIKDIIISEKDSEGIKIRIVMSDERLPDFNVIPIPQEPVRLAIDFKNTRSKPINKAVNLLNVRQIRGAYNSPSTYRVVFDLEYLKKYNVSPILGGKGVEVAFFTEGEANSHDSQVVASSPPSSAPIDIEMKEEGVVLSNTSETPENIQVSTTEPAAVPGNGENSEENGKPGGNGNENPPTAVISNLDDTQTQMNNQVTITQNQQGTTTITNLKKEIPGDFFGDEKSSLGEEAVPLQEAKDAAKASTTPGSSYTTFVRQTIEQGERKYKGEPMGFNFHNADLKDVIKIIAKISGLNIVLDPGVTGRVTSQLTQVPWDQALELFLKINGLDMVQEGNIIRIGQVEELKREAQRRLDLKNAQQLEGDLTIFTRTLSYAKASEVISILKKQLSSRGEILEDTRNNTLIISEVPGRIDIIDKLIDTLDTPSPQVSIEARIVEAQANYVESLGIQWGYDFIADAAHGNQTTLKFPSDVAVHGNQYTSQASPLIGPLGGYAVNLPATGANAGTVFTLGNIANTFRLDVALSAMQNKGDGRIISAPKTTTQNNMPASLMQGKLLPVQTLQNNTVTVQWRPAALELKVTPQISADGSIICALEIENNEADFGNQVNGIPPIQTQSIKTTVRVTDGGTIVIGGMYRIEKFNTTSGVPFFSKIPLLGSLFKNRNKRGEQRELLVFITPRIIK